MNENFTSLTSRLHFIQFCSDQFTNFCIWQYLSVFEMYVYGVISQFNRIIENNRIKINTFSKSPLKTTSTQLRLDIYYYTLNWDKIDKIFNKIKELLNTINKNFNSIPYGFTVEFRIFKKRIESLLSNFNKDVRNEFEHPTLETKRSRNMIEWSNINILSNDDIIFHVGKEQFSIIKKDHVNRINTLWIDLIDLFIKHFSDKPLTASLIQLKNQIESNIDQILIDYNNFINQKENDKALNLFNLLLNIDSFLAKEDMPLSDEVKGKLNSIIFKK